MYKSSFENKCNAIICCIYNIFDVKPKMEKDAPMLRNLYTCVYSFTECCVYFEKPIKTDIVFKPKENLGTFISPKTLTFGSFPFCINDKTFSSVFCENTYKQTLMEEVQNMKVV